MTWNGLIISNSNGAITEENIDEFNVKFWSKLNEEHDSDLPDGTLVEFKTKVMGLRLAGHYCASWIGDADYPDETEPDEIELDAVNGALVA